MTELIDDLMTACAARRPKILVVGDVMLDHYRIGEASRISPEAPVPVLLNCTSEYRLGGAGAVAAMCVALGAEVSLVGVIGHDEAGQRVYDMMEQQRIVFAGKTSLARRTTVKERICAIASGRHRQQIARLDTEIDLQLDPQAASEIADFITSMAGDPPDAIILSDYGKGVVTELIVAACRNVCSLTLVDPCRHPDWPKYLATSCIVPNREEACGLSAKGIAMRAGATCVVVKKDQDGCEYYTRPLETRRVMARNRAVHDVTGAGDQFISVLAWSRACGLDWPEAVRLSNEAAGLQVERHGCVPVTSKELTDAIASTIPAQSR